MTKPTISDSNFCSLTLCKCNIAGVIIASKSFLSFPKIILQIQFITYVSSNRINSRIYSRLLEYLELSIPEV